MPDEEYMMHMGEIVLTSAQYLGWNKDMEDNPIQFLVQAAYEDGLVNGFRGAEDHSFEVGV
jgi:hypothetical protein